MRNDVGYGDCMASERDDHPGHRALAGGAARAGVFGFSDGLVSNVSLIIGIAASGVGPSYVRLAGIAAAVAGAVSMAAGEWVSISAQNDLVRREMAIELRELRVNASAETSELAAMYRAHGMATATAAGAAAEVMRDPERAAMVHAREEFGLDPAQLPRPVQIAVVSLVTFLAGAVIPVLPWTWATGSTASATSIALGVAAALAGGAAIGRQAERNVVRTALRQAAIMLLAVAATWVIGRVVGVSL